VLLVVLAAKEGSLVQKKLHNPKPRGPRWVQRSPVYAAPLRGVGLIRMIGISSHT
jgi:hypothetical protein